MFSSYHRAVIVIFIFILGVENIDANVDTKIVKVTCTDVIENDHLYEPLKKWADKAGKTLELVLDENNNIV